MRLNSKITQLAVVVTLCCSSASASDVQLPASVRSKLDAITPGWQLALPDADVAAFGNREWGVSSEAMAVLRGDFDGNGREDFAVHIVYGPTSTKRRLIAFLRTGAGYHAYTLDDGESTGQRYLRLARRGTVWTDQVAERRNRVAHDSIQLNVFEKSGRTFVFRNGRFRAIATSD